MRMDGDFVKTTPGTTTSGAKQTHEWRMEEKVVAAGYGRCRERRWGVVGKESVSDAEVEGDGYF